LKKSPAVQPKRPAYPIKSVAGPSGAAAKGGNQK